MENLLILQCHTLKINLILGIVAKKSQVLNYFNNQTMKGKKIDKNKIAKFSFQHTAIKYLINKTKLALNEYNVNSLTLAEV